MKKNTSMRIAVLLALSVVITTVFVGYTYAKYVSTAEGDSEATVAKWEMKVNGTNIAVENPTIAFALFDTINEEDTITEETNVADGKIAPGTGGSFALSVSNTAEVDAKFAIAFAIDNANIPLEFKVGDSDWSSTLSNIPETNISMGTTSNVIVKWRWAYENNQDATDTTLGITPENIEITATITATQVD